MKTNLQELKVCVSFYPDGSSQPYLAYALNGKTCYDWKTGLPLD